ncbi:MAG: hypothetical protein OXU45_07580 [Candidatus Melainabacteria bacterium]|nr:hypothetical protein [Candidatus Melainabacteria bacterium]
MPGLILLVVSSALALTLLAFNSFFSFQGFHKQVQPLNDWDTMALASSTRVSKITSNFLLALRDSLLASIDSYDKGEVDSKLNTERLTIVEEYFSDLQGKGLRNTIEFGLNPYGKQDSYEDYQVELIHSDYLPAKFDEDGKSYASTLLSTGQKTKPAATDVDEYINEAKLSLSSSLLDSLLGIKVADFVRDNSALLGITVSDSGLSLPVLANGLQVAIVTSSD